MSITGFVNTAHIAVICLRCGEHLNQSGLGLALVLVELPRSFKSFPIIRLLRDHSLILEKSLLKPQRILIALRGLVESWNSKKALFFVFMFISVKLAHSEA